MDHKPIGTAFEANVLAKQQFESIAIPFTGMSHIGWYLKLGNKRIIANDICQWAWWVGRARIENNNDQLAEDHLSIILNDINDDLANDICSNLNSDLQRWFSNNDANWLAQVRENIDRLPSDNYRALALFAGILTGDYILGFTSQTQFLRRPLTVVYREMVKIVNRICDNQGLNYVSNLEALDFIVRTRADLMYAKLPTPGSIERFIHSSAYWREVWVRKDTSIAREIWQQTHAHLGGIALSKARYLQSIAELLDHAKHIPIWALSFSTYQQLSLSEISHLVEKHRTVKQTYTKDSGGLVGGQLAYIMIAVNP